MSYIKRLEVSKTKRNEKDVEKEDEEETEQKIF